MKKFKRPSYAVVFFYFICHANENKVILKIKECTVAVFANLVGEDRELGQAFEVPAGAEVLVRNYPEAEEQRLSVLRPFEVVAYLR